MQNWLHKTYKVLTNAASVVLLLMTAWACSCHTSDKAPSSWDETLAALDSACWHTDTARSRALFIQAKTLSKSRIHKLILEAYGVSTQHRIDNQDTLIAIASELEPLSAHRTNIKAALMHMYVAWADIIDTAGMTPRVHGIRSRTAALAFELGRNDIFVDQQTSILKAQELAGNYTVAISGYRQLIAFCQNKGLRENEKNLLYHLELAFISMGDLPMALYYLDDIQHRLDTSAIERCHYYGAISRYYCVAHDTALFRQSMNQVALYMTMPHVTEYFRSTLDGLWAEYYLSFNKVDSAMAAIARLDKYCPSKSRSMYEKPEYRKLLRARAMLSLGKNHEAKEILDSIDAASLRATDVVLFETYADVVKSYYMSVGDDYNAYYFTKQKSNMLDSLRSEIVGHNLAYMSLSHRLDTTMISQDARMTEVQMEKRKLSIMRGIGTTIALLTLGLSIGFYYYWDMRRSRKRSEMLEALKTNLAEEVRLRKIELEAQRKLLSEKNEALLKEMQFAKHVQTNILPSDNMLKFNGLCGHFVFWRPCLLIGGDFYWYHQMGEKLFVCVGDATGHGVPGALIAMAASTLLSDLAADGLHTTPADLMEGLSNDLQRILRENRKIANKDSVDMSIVCIDNEAQRTTISLARQKAYVVNADGKPRKIEGVKRSVAEPAEDAQNQHFTNTDIDLRFGDCLYLTSDGFESQFGGPRNTKLKRKGLVTMLQEGLMLSMEEQGQELQRRFDEWKGHNDQTDDVLVIGLRFCGYGKQVGQ